MYEPHDTQRKIALGGFVHELVKCRENVVGKLDFRDGRAAVGCDADAKARNALLAQGRVEHTAGKTLGQVLRRAEHAAKLDVFAKNNCE